MNMQASHKIEHSPSLPIYLDDSCSRHTSFRASTSLPSSLTPGSRYRTHGNPGEPNSKFPSISSGRFNSTPISSSSLIWNTAFRWLLPPLHEIHSSSRRSLLLRWLKWLLVIYVPVCVCVFSWSCILEVVQLRSKLFSINAVPPVIHMSKLAPVPTDTLLSKLSMAHQNIVAVDPFVVGNTNSGTITACLWTNETDIDLLHTWVSRWAGSVSLVVTTHSVPGSPEHINLLQKISSLKKIPSIKSSTSIHMLHLKDHATDNPNAYLNLARLFSPAPQVILFPGNLSVVPPKTFYKSFFLSSSSFNFTSDSTMVFASRGHFAYPFSPLSPAVINRDDPLWCTERFFPSLSRESDWMECLWQLWLKNFGELDVKATSEWVQVGSGVSDPTSSMTKLRRRLSAKYRSETCMLATRQLAALKTPERNSIHAKRGRWLKRHCREWATLE
ncbi:hypothetical protein ABKN59_005473 [Abortiporus biennis]